MSSRSSIVVSALIAVIMAVAVIVAASSLGVLETRTGSLASSNSSTESTVSYQSQVTASVGAATQTSATSTQSGSGGQSGNGQAGTLAVLMTDPPTVPSGVTAVYISYANLGIHVSNAGNQTGWHIIKVSGQIDLMSVINFTQTVSTANITSGIFNAFGFNITSAIVTYQGQNYTAYLVYGHNLLFVPIVGGITIQNGVASAAVIDMTTTVLLLTNSSSSTDFSFAFIPSARAYTVPAQSVPTLHLHVGDRDDIHAAPWWVSIFRGTHFEITSVKLTPHSLAITVANTGNASILFRAAAITSTVSQFGGWQLPVESTEVFVCEPNASLVATAGEKMTQINSLVVAGGYLLPPSASATFTYVGNFSLGLQLVIHPVSQHGTTTQASKTQQGVIVGQKYIITIFGNGHLSQTAVIATSS